MPEQPPKPVEKLADDINELESLLDARKTSRPAAGARVPILDDIVEPAAGPADKRAPGLDATAIENRVLRRLDAELAELPTVIREVVRRCIREELAPGTRDRPSPDSRDDD